MQVAFQDKLIGHYSKIFNMVFRTILQASTKSSKHKDLIKIEQKEEEHSLTFL